MIKMIVFDMAGTTVDEDNVVYKTLRAAIAQAGYELTLDDVLLLGAGKEKLQAIKDILTSLDGQEAADTQADSIYSYFRQELKKAYQDLNVKTYPGTEALFENLKVHHIKVVLNTGYDQQTATSLLEKLQWQAGKQYDLLVTADDVSNGRPEPDMILLAMEKMSISEAAQVAKVGDSKIDIEEGKSAGCGLTFGVTTGAQTAEQLQEAEPDYIIHSLTQMEELITLHQAVKP
ncbi:MAG: phosphonatase-like hydrolase [Cyclobacteriaceae bacterium]